MPKVDFTKIYEKLRVELTDLAKSTVKNYVKDAEKDAHNMLNEMKEKLERWSLSVTAGSLTTSDFEWLVNSQRDLIQMASLKKAGLAQIRIDQFKNSVLNLIVDTILHAIK